VEHSRFGAIVRQPWVFALIAGAATGLLVLGVGGRIAMRLFAIHNGQSPSWTLGGTVAVLFMGVVSGVGGAAIRAAASTWLPRRAPTAVGTAIFAVACLFLTLRGLHPVDAPRLAFFLPLTVVYAVVFELVWRRRPIGGTEPADPRPATVGA
jgi:hypothetical protein